MRLTRTFDWRGREVRWERLGDGPPLVFCHGTPWSAQVWAPFATALAPEFTVHMWDMPGYGQSSKQPHHEVDLGVQGELFADLLRHWGLERPHVVAHDIGGAVALRAHLLHAATYASLCLVDVVALAPWGSDWFRLVRDHAETFAAVPEPVHRGAVEAYVAGASRRGLTDEQLGVLVEPWLGDVGRAAFYRQIAQADQRFTDEVEARYGEIDLPVHVVWGTDDAWIPVDRAHRLRDAIPGALLELVEGAGHLVQYDAPVELAVALHRWLGRRRS